MAFKVKPKKKRIDYTIKDVEFEKIIVDADTPLFQAAKFVQEDYIIATHKVTGEELEFRNKTEFHGHWVKKEGGWIGEQNKDLTENGCEPISADDYEIEECARLSAEFDNHIEEAITSFDFFVGRIKKSVKADDYLLCIGGDGNFRYDYAKILPYKGERKAKPLLFQEVKEAIISKYRNNIEVVDDEESDDRLGQYGWLNYLNYKKTGEWKYCLAYVDKDLNMIISPSFNYDKIDEGITYTTPEMAAYCFCKQLLSGDKSTDNIQGLPNFTSEIQQKYGLRKSRGVGKASAEEMLKGCDSIQEMFSRVAEAYKSYYGDSYKFRSHTMEELEWSWLDFLQENAVLLYMRRQPNEVYNIRKALARAGVNVGG